MAMAVQDLPGDCTSKAVFKIFTATALSNSVSRRHSSLRHGGDGGSRSSLLASLRGAHIYPLPVALFPALY
jgi:hypothetical protein